MPSEHGRQEKGREGKVTKRQKRQVKRELPEGYKLFVTARGSHEGRELMYAYKATA